MDRKTIQQDFKTGGQTKGITQEQLAECAGFTSRAVQYWEQGKKNITLENAAKLLDALGLELKIEIKPA